MDNSMFCKWEYTGVSVIGSGHQKSDTPCQDACRTEQIGNFFVSAISDGAGTAKYSDIAAKILTDQAIEHIRLWNLPDKNEKIWKEHLHELMDNLRKALYEKADEIKCPPKELAATLLLVIVSPSVVAGLQIGDGAIIYAHQNESELHLLIHPEKNEYLNETTFITSEKYREKMQTAYLENHNINRVALISDGLQMLALDIKVNPPKPHPGFFNTFFESLNQANSTERSEQLTEFLSSPRICSRTDDDKTLVFAARTTPATAESNQNINTDKTGTEQKQKTAEKSGANYLNLLIGTIGLVAVVIIYKKWKNRS
jgi:hypothetical protein